MEKIKKMYHLFIYMPFIKKDKFYRDCLIKNLFLPNALLFSFNLKKDSIVFDIGGYRGEWSKIINKRYSPQIFIFEPVKKYAENLVKKFAKYTNIQIFPFGLADAHKELSISIEEESSSIYKTSNNVENVVLESLTDFLQKHDLQKIDLIKINIEGGEYDLLEELLVSGGVEKINYVLVQFHNFVPGAETRRTKIIDQLQNTHESVFSYPFLWELFKLK